MISRRVASGLFVLVWITTMAFLSWFFAYWLDRTQESVQSLEVTAHEIRVILTANRSNHYVAKGNINGKHASFIIDTGASTVSIPEHFAKIYGLKKGRPIRAITASGIVKVYPTRIKTLTIGPITLKNVRAAINPHMPSRHVLLGMTALKRLHIELKHGRLILIQPQ